jgi:hypothetical protein
MIEKNNGFPSLKRIDDAGQELIAVLGKKGLELHGGLVAYFDELGMVPDFTEEQLNEYPDLKAAVDFWNDHNQ